jgi:hypothetical protein
MLWLLIKGAKPQPHERGSLIVGGWLSSLAGVKSRLCLFAGF